MKRFLISMAALLAVVGCAKQDSPESPDKGYAPEFEVEFEDSNAFIDEPEDGFKLTWTEGDLFSCFFNTGGNAKYKFMGETGDYAGGIEPVASPEGTLLDTYYAVYPYNENNELVNGKLSITLPAEQTYAEDTFGPNSNTMIAVNTDKDLLYTFSNICGFVRLKVWGEATITSITFEGNSEEIIAGEVLVVPTTKKITFTGEGTTITLDCGEGVALGDTFAKATEFWMAVPPKTFRNGFTLTLNDTEGKSMTKTFKESVTIGRNTIHDAEI